MCGESITNPLCNQCLTEEVVQWLSEKNQLLVPIIRDMNKLVSELQKINVHCISCNNKLRICAYCYCKELRDFVGEELKVSFNKTFDFTLIKQERAA